LEIFANPLSESPPIFLSPRDGLKKEIIVIILSKYVTIFEIVMCEDGGGGVGAGEVCIEWEQWRGRRTEGDLGCGYEYELPI